MADMDHRERELTAGGAFRVTERDTQLVGAVGLVKRLVAVIIKALRGKLHVDKRCSSPGVRFVFEHLPAGRRVAAMTIDLQRASQKG